MVHRTHRSLSVKEYLCKKTTQLKIKHNLEVLWGPMLFHTVGGQVGVNEGKEQVRKGFSIFYVFLGFLELLPQHIWLVVCTLHEQSNV